MGRYSYGLYSYGLYRYCLHSYGTQWGIAESRDGPRLVVDVCQPLYRHRTVTERPSPCHCTVAVQPAVHPCTAPAHPLCSACALPVLPLYCSCTVACAFTVTSLYRWSKKQRTPRPTHGAFVPSSHRWRKMLATPNGDTKGSWQIYATSWKPRRSRPPQQLGLTVCCRCATDCRVTV